MDVLIIGAGQAGLAVGYHLRRTGLSFRLLDAGHAPGGAWVHGWHSLRLFSPAQWSSLPGWPMTRAVETNGYPTRDDAVRYLAAYEARYELPVDRPVRVERVERGADGMRVETSRGTYAARAVVSATGTHARPYVPGVEGRDRFRGVQLHSAHYRRPEAFAGRRVLVVGGGNSGAQIQAELSQVAEATWVTLVPPRFLPDDVDGRVLFDRATAQYHARQQGLEAPPSYSLGDIVVLPPVARARERGALEARRPFVRMTATGVVWPDGDEEAVDVVVWCTGFRPALDHLVPLGVVRADGRVAVEGTRSVDEPRLWLVGYGGWTGFASATLVGVGRSARATARQIADALR